jgi:hypothetical protein
VTAQRRGGKSAARIVYFPLNPVGGVFAASRDKRPEIEHVAFWQAA